VWKNHIQTFLKVSDVRERARWSRHQQARRGDPPGRPYLFPHPPVGMFTVEHLMTFLNDSMGDAGD
jgi:hypothetical protein